MFALSLNYLMGWAMAAVDGAKKERAEWPPHPDRLFMALAAAWFETGEEAAEGAALRWLENLPSPAIAASDATFRHASGGRRPTVSYTPVNDSQCGRKPPDDNSLHKLKDAGLDLLPEHRSRQPRSFPVAIPHHPIVHFIWSDNEPGEHKDALERLAHKVTRLGHSASLVQMWLEENPPAPVWQVSNVITPHRLRVFGAGRLDYLRARMSRAEATAYADLQASVRLAKGTEKKMLKQKLDARFGQRAPVSLRPEAGLSLGYGPVEIRQQPGTTGTVFDPNLIVLTLSGRRYPLASTLKLAEVLRGAVLKLCAEPRPEWVSGHAADGAASRQPHLAIFPLPFVGHEHADGRLMGVALAIPRGVTPSEAARCLNPFLWNTSDGTPNHIRLFGGQWFESAAELELREKPPHSLRANQWTRASKTWASVTPVVLDRHFDGADKWDHAAESVKDSCDRVGLPRPASVLLHPVSLVEGVPHAREFPYITRKSDGGRMHHSHAVIVFDERVQGPLLLGAGRFRGYGLCRPMDRESGHA